MVTALDSSVLLDILLNDDKYADVSLRAVKGVRAKGRLIISPVVVSEIFPILGSQKTAGEFIKDFSIEFIDFGFETSLLAGGLFMKYRKNKGVQKRVIADFLVGAHSLFHADQLLTRDGGFYRPYFKDLKIISPANVF